MPPEFYWKKTKKLSYRIGKKNIKKVVFLFSDQITIL